MLTRRILQIRRACCKKGGKVQEYKGMIRRYAEKQMVDQEWPAWFQPAEPGQLIAPKKFPAAQPHPTTKDFDPSWNDSIKPLGPIGLIIDSLVSNGLVIDEHMRIWQQGEEPIDIMSMPYQKLKVMTNAMAARARTSL